MQLYDEVSGDTTISAFLGLALDNDKTIMSNSSGSTFPTQNLQQGMFCYRTDQQKLYILMDPTAPSWSLLGDMTRSMAYTDNPVFTGGVYLGDNTKGMVLRSDNSVSIISPSYVSMGGKNGSFSNFNAYYDGAAWNRYDVAQNAYQLVVNSNGAQVNVAAAGTNPITWTSYTIWHSGNITPAPIKDAQLQGAPTAPTPPASDSSQRLATTQWGVQFMAAYSPIAAVTGSVTLQIPDFPSYKYATADATINLPAPGGINAGKPLTIKNAGAWSVTIVPPSGVNIDGSNAPYRVPGWETIEVMSIGSAYIVTRGASAKVGDIKASAATIADAGWVRADGTNYSRVSYSGLFALVNTAFGAGDGSTSFGTPNLTGRTVIGVGATSGLSTRNLGDLLGEEAHILNISEIPAHHHTFQPPHNANSENGYGKYTTGGDADEGTMTAYDTTDTGGGGSHNNMQPSIALYYWIKV